MGQCFESAVQEENEVERETEAPSAARLGRVDE